jgi:hypothetical protein
MIELFGRTEYKILRDDDGKLHSANSPAIQYSNGDETWYFHGKFHRVDGPAIDWPLKNYYVYYINGVQYSKEVFERIIKLRVFL